MLRRKFPLVDNRHSALYSSFTGAVLPVKIADSAAVNRSSQFPIKTQGALITQHKKSACTLRLQFVSGESAADWPNAAARVCKR